MTAPGNDSAATQWPPAYYDPGDGQLHPWDALVAQDPDEQPGPPLTYRQLAYEICDAWGGLEDFLDHQWLRQGGRPEPRTTPPAQEGTECIGGCGAPAEIEASLGWVCWPCYETGQYDG